MSSLGLDEGQPPVTGHLAQPSHPVLLNPAPFVCFAGEQLLTINGHHCYHCVSLYTPIMASESMALDELGFCYSLLLAAPKTLLRGWNLCVMLWMTFIEFLPPLSSKLLDSAETQHLFRLQKKALRIVLKWVIITCFADYFLIFPYIYIIKYVYFYPKLQPI